MLTANLVHVAICKLIFFFFFLTLIGIEKEKQNALVELSVENKNEKENNDFAIEMLGGEKDKNIYILEAAPSDNFVESHLQVTSQSLP